MSIKSMLKRPAYISFLLVSYTADLLRYVWNASVIFLGDSEKKLGYLIRKDNHRIEKGLALPNPRLWFGDPVLTRLLANVRRYKKFNSINTTLLDETASVLLQYKTCFSKKSAAPKNIETKLVALEGVLGQRAPFKAGTFEITKEQVAEALEIDFGRFFSNRYSVRQFNGEVIPNVVVENSVQLALKTPSVCNRCAWRVYNISDPVMVKKVLACQNGNAGFGDTCGNVLVVAMDLRSFEGAGERNQAYVDGGLFAMSLALALHSNAVASCFLNWSANFFQDMRLRKAISIPSNEVVITLIGIGGYPDQLPVAISPRPALETVLTSI